ncbi:MAG: hypothetical protein V7K94_28975 [Nostoc sp.]
MFKQVDRNQPNMLRIVNSIKALTNDSRRQLALIAPTYLQGALW